MSPLKAFLLRISPKAQDEEAPCTMVIFAFSTSHCMCFAMTLCCQIDRSMVAVDWGGPPFRHTLFVMREDRSYAARTAQ